VHENNTPVEGILQEMHQDLGEGSFSGLGLEMGIILRALVTRTPPVGISNPTSRMARVAPSGISTASTEARKGSAF